MRSSAEPFTVDKSAATVTMSDACDLYAFAEEAAKAEPSPPRRIDLQEEKQTQVNEEVEEQDVEEAASIIKDINLDHRKSAAEQESKAKQIRTNPPPLPRVSDLLKSDFDKPRVSIDYDEDDMDSDGVPLISQNEFEAAQAKLVPLTVYQTLELPSVIQTLKEQTPEETKDCQGALLLSYMRFRKAAAAINIDHELDNSPLERIGNIAQMLTTRDDSAIPTTPSLRVDASGELLSPLQVCGKRKPVSAPPRLKRTFTWESTESADMKTKPGEFCFSSDESQGTHTRIQHKRRKMMPVFESPELVSDTGEQPSKDGIVFVPLESELTRSTPSPVSSHGTSLIRTPESKPMPHN